MSEIFISQNETIKTSTLWFLYIVIPLVLTAIILLIIYLFKKKKKK